MARACVLLAPGFEEIEAITIIDVLRRGSIETVAVGMNTANITGSHGIMVTADCLLTEVISEDWDAVVLPGGMPGAANLRDDDDVQTLLQRQHAAGGLVAAICAAPIALAAAGILGDRAATSYPSYESALQCRSYRSDPVVVDGNVTTSRAPGTALRFALSLVEQLSDKSTADQVRTAMLVDA